MRIAGRHRTIYTLPAFAVADVASNSRKLAGDVKHSPIAIANQIEFYPGLVASRPFSSRVITCVRAVGRRRVATPFLSAAATDGRGSLGKFSLMSLLSATSAVMAQTAEDMLRQVSQCCVSCDFRPTAPGHQQ